MAKHSASLVGILSLSIMTSITLPVFSQNTLALYADSIPNSKPTADGETSEINKDSVLIISKISRPTLTVYQPVKDKRTGAAVIICPGGGYSVEAAGHEGAD